MSQKQSGANGRTEAEPQPDVPDNSNGGPNHLRAWMRYRRVKSVSLARSLNVSQGVISQLISGRNALSARWLRLIAPLLEISPGMLLDYDPSHLDEDTIEKLMKTYLTGGSDR